MLEVHELSMLFDDVVLLQRVFVVSAEVLGSWRHSATLRTFL